MKENNNFKNSPFSGQDEFIHRITHDLKAPLRGIQNLTQWIQEDIKSGNIESLNENIQLVDLLVIRTNKMMDAIKDYSQINHEEDKIGHFKSPEYVESIVSKYLKNEQIDINIESNKFNFSAYKKKLFLCLNAVIENAIEHNANSNAKVLILIEENEQTINFNVKDNGPGIPDHMKNNIFGLFTTTKAKEDTKFIGVGLALAHRAIETVGGSLEIVSDDHGTNVSIVWPKVVNKK